MSQIVVISPTELHSLVARAVQEGVQSAIRSTSQPLADMNEKQASLYLGIAADTLRGWRVQKTGPAYYKSGRSVRYSKTDLDEWKRANRVLTADSLEIQERLHGMSY
ncbi:MAG: helix-turn-helix domain-containing protein [Desulfovibrio sp.]|nr:helix-turn-helix domain-containing protein [Desulfovibrio sp.]